MSRLDRWLLQPGPAERLAALRILIGAFVWIYMLANVGEFARLASRPSSPFEPVGVARVLDTPLPAVMVWTLFVMLLVVGACFVVGLWYRYSGITYAVLVLIWSSYHSSWGQMLHFEHLFTLHLGVLALSPVAVVWSFDARQRTAVAEPSSTRYGWPIRLMAIITTLTYVIAAVTKLRRSGLSWLDGSTLRNHIAYSATRIDLLGGFEPPLASFVVGRAWLIAPMAVGAIVIELIAPVALIGGRARTYWVSAALLFHLGTAATMMVWFPYQGLGFAFLPLLWAGNIAGLRRST